MPTLSAHALGAVFGLALLLAAAVVTDLRSRRIPNRLVAVGILVALVFHAKALWLGVAPVAGAAWWSPLAGLLAGGACLLPLYLLRATGAGDVKLMAMVGAFIGVKPVLGAALYTLVVGGLLSIGWMLARGVAAQTIENTRFLLTDSLVRSRSGQGARLAPLAVTAARLPYGIAIACGSAAALLWPLAGR